MQKGTIHMTLRECYEMMCGDYEGVTGRLVSESLVRKFALKFLNDPSFGQLQAAIESGDGAEAFRASHTLKGICLNLGFTALFDASSDLTEKLRGDRKSTRLNSSHLGISYAVFCLKKEEENLLE